MPENGKKGRGAYDGGVHLMVERDSQQCFFADFVFRFIFRYGRIQSSSNNPHIAEERQMNNVDDSGINEEDKYVPFLPITYPKSTSLTSTPRPRPRPL